MEALMSNTSKELIMGALETTKVPIYSRLDEQAAVALRANAAPCGIGLGACVHLCINEQLAKKGQ